MVTSETVPFSKSGGLADVVGALSAALVRKGNEIAILMPAYSIVDLTGFSKPLSNFNVSICGTDENVSIREKIVNGVRYWAVCHPLYTERKGIYGDTSFKPYSDNFSRFMLLDKTALKVCKNLNWKPDVIHSHDWTTGMVSFLLKQSKDKFFHKTKTVFTIHNLAYQGDFTRFDALSGDFTPDERCFSGVGLEKRLNMLKTGLVCSDAITTVSPTYAQEIQTKEYGCGLNDILTARKKDLTGIINGIDYEEWNSETDPFLKTNYRVDDLTGKKKLKASVQEEFGLEVNDTIPLVSLITRLAEQKGLYELLEDEPCALERLASIHDVQFLIIGTGDENIVKKLKDVASRRSNVSVNILFSNEKAHRVEGASDFFLMPSRYEPCGLNQLYSLHYGTIPIARRTGGLADSIVDVDDNKEKATGYLFSEMSGQAIEKAVNKALDLYKNDPEEIINMRVRGMNTDFTWDHSATEYTKVYTKGEI